MTRSHEFGKSMGMKICFCVLALAWVGLTGCANHHARKKLDATPVPTTFDQKVTPTNDDPNHKDIWLVDFGGAIDVDRAKKITILMDTKGLYWFGTDCGHGVAGACKDSIKFESVRTNPLFDGLASDRSHVTLRAIIDMGEGFYFPDSDGQFEAAKDAIRSGKFHMSVARDGDNYEVQYVELIVTYR